MPWTRLIIPSEIVPKILGWTWSYNKQSIAKTEWNLTMPQIKLELSVLCSLSSKCRTCRANIFEILSKSIDFMNQISLNNQKETNKISSQEYCNSFFLISNSSSVVQSSCVHEYQPVSISFPSEMWSRYLTRKLTFLLQFNNKDEVCFVEPANNDELTDSCRDSCSGCLHY